MSLVNTTFYRVMGVDVIQVGPVNGLYAAYLINKDCVISDIFTWLDEDRSLAHFREVIIKNFKGKTQKLRYYEALLSFFETYAGILVTGTTPS